MRQAPKASSGGSSAFPGTGSQPPQFGCRPATSRPLPRNSTSATILRRFAGANRCDRHSLPSRCGLYKRSTTDIRISGGVSADPERREAPTAESDMNVTRLGAGPVSLRPKAPQASVWAELARGGRLPPWNPVVDVIVPVYRGYDDTLACIHSVLASHNTTAYELVVINDDRPEPDLVIELKALADRGLIHLIHKDAK